MGESTEKGCGAAGEAMTTNSMPRPPIEEYEALAEKATGGKWVWEPSGSDNTKGIWPKGKKYEPIVETDGGYYRPSQDDARFICASREAVPALCSYARSLEARVAELEGALREIDEHPNRLKRETEAWTYRAGITEQANIARKVLEGKR